jgi:hypothetical protein
MKYSDLIHFEPIESVVQLRVSGGQRIHACVQTMDRQDAKTGALQNIINEDDHFQKLFREP